MTLSLAWQRGLGALVVVAALVGCSADKPKPTPLESYTPKVAGRLVWQSRLDSVKFPLIVPVRNGQFVVAGTDGAVVALQADDGREVWRGNAGAKLSAGVGSDGRYASVVTVNNDVVTFDNGKEIWRQRLGAHAVTAPLVAGERVFVMSVDRVVQAFDALDGRRLWTLQRPGDALTLAQAGVVAAYKNTLLVGQGVRLTGVDPLKGTVQWELPMASPRGTNEVERLADLIGPVLRVGDRVCARSFQSAVSCVDAAKGTLSWSRNVGGTMPVGGDEQLVFGADASSRITAWRQADGEVAWTSEKLLYRGLSGATSVGPVVVFGDFEGQVHFLSAANGEQQLRLPTDGSAVVGVPALSGKTVLVITQNGGLFAFRPN